MSRKSDNNLIVKLKVSYWLAAILAVTHLGAFVLVFLIDVPSLLRLVLATALILSLSATLMRYALRQAPQAIESLRWETESGLSVKFYRQDLWQLTTITSCFVHPWLVLLSLRVAGRRIPLSLIVAADGVDPEAFRRLRAALLAPRQSPAA